MMFVVTPKPGRRFPRMSADVGSHLSTMTSWQLGLFSRGVIQKYMAVAKASLGSLVIFSGLASRSRLGSPTKGRRATPAGA